MGASRGYELDLLSQLIIQIGGSLDLKSTLNDDQQKSQKSPNSHSVACLGGPGKSEVRFHRAVKVLVRLRIL